MWHQTCDWDVWRPPRACTAPSSNWCTHEGVEESTDNWRELSGAVQSQRLPVHIYITLPRYFVILTVGMGCTCTSVQPLICMCLIFNDEKAAWKYPAERDQFSSKFCIFSHHYLQDAGSRWKGTHDFRYYIKLLSVPFISKSWIAFDYIPSFSPQASPSQRVMEWDSVSWFATGGKRIHSDSDSSSDGDMEMHDDKDTSSSSKQGHFLMTANFSKWVNARKSLSRFLQKISVRTLTNSTGRPLNDRIGSLTIGTIEVFYLIAVQKGCIGVSN